MSETILDPRAAEALLEANSLVSACLFRDFDFLARITKSAHPQEAWLVLALAKLTAEILKAWAEVRGEDPEDLWGSLALETVRHTP